MTGGSHIFGNSPWLVYLSPPAFWVVEDISNLVNAGEGNQQTELGGAHRATQPPMEGFKVKCTRNSGLNYVLGF